jgi:signal peptidase I
VRSTRLLAAALALGLTPFAFVHPVRVSGRSMEPLLRDGEVHFALRAWCAGRPRPGQIWLAATPGGTVVKRLAAGPGTLVELRDGALWLDGQYVPEPYVARTERAVEGPWNTGQGWFLLGDNREESRDSRAWGVLPASNLEARLLK